MRRAKLAIVSRARSGIIAARLQVAFPRLEVDRVASCDLIARLLAAEHVSFIATSQSFATRVFATTLVCNLVICGTCHR